MQKAQQDAWAQRSVRRGAARRDGQGRFNAVSEVSRCRVLCNIVYMQKAQQDASAQRSVRRGAARRDGQGRFNAVSEFSPFILNFSLVPSCEGKIQYVPEKKSVLREKFSRRCRTAELERTGGAGPRWRAGPGLGPGRGRAGQGRGVGGRASHRTDARAAERVQIIPQTRVTALVELVGPQEAWESLGTVESYTAVSQLHAFTNEMHSDSDASFTTAEQLSSILNCCDLTFSMDRSNTCHLVLWAECCRELLAEGRSVLATRPDGGQRLTWIDALVNGCTPSTCLGGARRI